jgi:Flp pilus assembly protein TadD
MYLALGRSAEARGELENAMQTYRYALEIDDAQPEVLHRLALLHDRMGKCEEARDFYLQAIELAPGNADLQCDFAYSCYLQNQWDEAEQGLRRAIELAPNLARAHNNLGLLLARTGRSDEALWEFGRAGATEPQARANLAFAMLLDGHVSPAKQQLALAAGQASDPLRADIGKIHELIRRSAAPDTQARLAQYCETE